jgi:hypothetical protein
VQPVCRGTLVCHHNISGAPQIFIRNCIFVRYSYKKAVCYISASIVFYNMCNVLFSYACILIGQVFIYRYISMAMYSLVPPFREATYCGALSCVFDKSGCAAGEKRLQNTALRRDMAEIRNQ